jgi:hypothetical protein
MNQPVTLQLGGSEFFNQTGGETREIPPIKISLKALETILLVQPFN